MNHNEVIKLIKLTLKKIRPYLQADGGDVDFVKFEDVDSYESMVYCIHEDYLASHGLIAEQDVIDKNDLSELF